MLKANSKRQVPDDVTYTDYRATAAPVRGSGVWDIKCERSVLEAGKTCRCKVLINLEGQSFLSFTHARLLKNIGCVLLGNLKSCFHVDVTSTHSTSLDVVVDQDLLMLPDTKETWSALLSCSSYRSWTVFTLSCLGGTRRAFTVSGRRCMCVL